MPVAKSYIALEQTCEPYKKNSRWYVRVRQTSGAEKEVRWYSEAEYEKMYPDEAKTETVTRVRSIKDVLGFEKGYITIFRGDCTPLQEWFEQSCARYSVLWGWYIISTDEIPPLPAGISAVELSWDAVSLADGALKPPTAITEVVNELINDPSPSRWQGSIGERIDRSLTVVKIVPIEGYYGSSNFYLFQDTDKNEYCWTTAARQLELGSTYEIRGSIKEHQKYKGKQQTVLTRCKVN